MDKQITEPITRDWIITLIAEGYNTHDLVKNYQISEETILNSTDLLEKEVLIDGLSFTEDFINKALEIGFFQDFDIRDLSMKTYSGLSEKFIAQYSEFINWNRMILYISTQSDNFDKYIDIIEKHNLWSVISANDLPIDFIRQWKDKLDWKFLSFVKFFTDEEKLEFSDYIIVKNEHFDEDFIDNSKFQFVNKMTNEELEQLIDEINKHLYKDWYPKEGK